MELLEPVTSLADIGIGKGAPKLAIETFGGKSKFGELFRTVWTF